MKNNNPYLNTIISAMEANDLQTALNKVQDWMRVAPENAEPHHILGLLKAQHGHFEQAIQAFQQAIALDPTQAVYHSNLSNAYKKVGNLEQAFLHIHQAIQLKPNYAEAYNNLGSLLYTQARYKEALAPLEKAVRLRPDYWEAHFNLANVSVKLDENLQAIEHYLEVLKLRPMHATSIQNLSMVYVAEARYDDALPLLEQVHQWQPEHPEILAQLGHLYLETGQSSKAIECYHKALQSLPDRGEIHHNLAVLYLRENNRTDALVHFEKALALDSDNDTARHMALALKGQQCEQAPRQYIASLFDQYANYYNAHVKEKLEYNVPGELRMATGQVLPVHSAQKRILDLGCGTGLCGVFFQDLAQWMVGVDISFGMLANAKALGAYHALCQLDILQALPGHGQFSFDLVLAADVLVYLGDLKALFQSVSEVLAPDGLFALTIETLTCGDEDYQLQSTGRFAHQTTYIEALAKQNQLEICLQKNLVLRKSKEQDIGGMIFILQK